MAITPDPHRLIGATAYDRGGTKVGKVAEVYYDHASGQPSWLTVKTGRFRQEMIFVPFAAARMSGEREVALDLDKSAVTTAPAIVPVEGTISRSEQRRLCQHYGVGDGDGRSSELPDGAAAGTARAGARAEGQGRAGDAMTRSEERLQVGTADQRARKVRLRKRVATKQVQVSVPVREEVLEAEREPLTGEDPSPAPASSQIAEDEHEIILHAETPVVTKKTVPVERVRLTKQQKTRKQTVTAEVRQERIEPEIGPADQPHDAGNQ